MADWTPADGIAVAVATLGPDRLLDWCQALLTGTTAAADPDQPDIALIGGPAAGSDPSHWLRTDLAYWPRVWAVRALRYVWQPEAAAAVRVALTDESWRVREHAATVVGLHELGELADPLATLLTDPVARVRRAAARSVALVGEVEHSAALLELTDDPDVPVAAAAADALRHLARRLDRPLTERRRDAGG